MKHHTVIPIHESKRGSILQQRARERNYDLFCLSSISQNLRRILYRNSLESTATVLSTDIAPRLEKVIIETLDLLENRVKRSYDEFKREYNAKEIKSANQSPE